MKRKTTVAIITLWWLVGCDPARVKEVHVKMPLGRACAFRFVENVDKIAHLHGYQSHPVISPQFPRHIAFWNRKAREKDNFPTLGCDIEYVEAENLLKIRIVRFPGSSLTPNGEKLYNDIMSLLDESGLRYQIVFDR